MTPVDEGAEGPLLRVVRGEPTPEELAALVAVVASRAAALVVADGTPAGRTGWSARGRLVRAPLHAGPGAWQASALPS